MSGKASGEVPRGRVTRRALGVLAAAACIAGCSGFPGSNFWSGAPPPPPPAQSSTAIGTGQVKVGLILPLSAPGNAGLAAQSMRNAAELALSEFNNPNIQLLIEDDAGTGLAAQSAAQQVIGQGAEIELGPLFAQPVSAAAQAARPRGVPIIAFSTDANVAGRGVYLLSFLPESEVDRIVDYAVGNGKRSFAALLPENAYGTVVDAELRQAVARKGGRIVALEHYQLDKVQEPVRRILAVADQIDSILIPDSADGVAAVVQALASNGLDRKHVQLMGTGLWDEPRMFADAALQGSWFAAPDPVGYRKFAARYRTKYGQEPVRTATLAYDAVSLTAALVKTQGTQRFSPETLTNPSGFSGVDGIFRFRPDGTNQRGLAVLRVEPGGAQVISQPPRAFSAGT